MPMHGVCARRVSGLYTPQKKSHIKLQNTTRTNVNNVTCHAADMIIHQLDGCHFVGVQFAILPAGAELVGQTCAAAFTRSSAAEMVGFLQGEAAYTTRGCSADPRTATGPGMAHQAPSGEEEKSARVGTTPTCTQYQAYPTPLSA